MRVRVLRVGGVVHTTRGKGTGEVEVVVGVGVQVRIRELLAYDAGGWMGIPDEGTTIGRSEGDVSKVLW